MSTNLVPAPVQVEESIRLGRTITRIFRRWRQQVELSLEDLDFTDATRMPLIVLQDHGGEMHQKDIAAALSVDTSSLVRVLRLLTERGLISCRPDTDDRRAKCISLTDEGRAQALRIIGRSMAIETAALSIYSESERETLRDLLERMSDHFENGLN